MERLIPWVCGIATAALLVGLVLVAADAASAAPEGDEPAAVLSRSHTPAATHVGTAIVHDGRHGTTVAPVVTTTPEAFHVVIRTDGGRVYTFPASAEVWADAEAGRAARVVHSRGRVLGWVTSVGLLLPGRRTRGG